MNARHRDQGLADCYKIIRTAARRRRARMAQLTPDPAVRTCTRCGGAAYLEGDEWRCWNCDATAGDVE